MTCGMFELMPISFEFLRGVLGIIGIGCAYMMGRSFAAVRKGTTKLSRMYAWVLRTTACVVGVGLRYSVDTMDLVVWGLVVVAAAGGFWDEMRPKKQEDLTKTIFPE